MSAGTGNPDWEAIERAMAAALELPEDQRAAWLAAQPPAMRAEVESLLAAYRRSGSFLEHETTAHLSGEPSSNLAAGTQVGPYRIEAVIGEGGMGVVYRALDTKLNRAVAIKFLFEELADPAARRRFQREAQMASSLNHPHILTVYDTGDFEGRQYLVTEYVDNGTLKDWARAEKRTAREIAALMTGVADGLATAHAAGILHRDIKPANILVGSNGYAKLSDFGLAKLEERQAPDQPTRILKSTVTRPGIILGTAAYMSPEQASGRPTDARSDIFSFGIVLYELIAGRRPFEGATDLELLGSIIHRAAPALDADVPLALRMVVEKALEKDPAERYQSARDLAVDLRRVARQSGESAAVAAPAPASRPAPRKPTLILTAIATLAALLLGGALLLWLQRPVAQAPALVTQFDISSPPESIFAPSVGRQPFAISPDGKRLAFTAVGANGTHLWIRDLASPEMHPLPGTQGAVSVFWPPDSRSIFFSTKQTLMQVNLETGSGRSVAALTFHAQFGTWRVNGDLLLYLGAGEIYELHSGDGSLQKIDASPGMRWPQFLPGSNRIVYVTCDPARHVCRGMAADYLSRDAVPLMETDSRVQYAPPRRAGEPGYLLFMHEASLLAQPFDADRLRLAGEAFPIAQNLVYYGPTLSTNFSVSANGVLVYQAGFPVTELNWYDRAGKLVGTAGQPAPQWGNVRLSRDGQRVAATVWSPQTGGAGVWIIGANRGESRRLTYPPEVHRRAVWSPDGTRLAMGASGDAHLGPRLAILDLAANGTAREFAKGIPAEQAAKLADFANLPTDWSPDGRLIALDDGVGHEVQKAVIADVTGHTVTPLLDSKFPQWGIAFSPDGARIAFASTQSGRPEINVQAFDPAPAPHLVGERRQVSRDGAWQVRWRADGRELFYLGLDNVLYVVPVKGPLEFGDPRPLFRVAGASQYGTSRDFQFDVSPDGQRFIMPTTGSVPPPPFTVVENWLEKFHR